jgi:hypothetical protein
MLRCKGLAAQLTLNQLYQSFVKAGHENKKTFFSIHRTFAARCLIHGNLAYLDQITGGQELDGWQRH